MHDPLPIAEHLARRAADSPDQTAVITPEGQLTFSELYELSGHCARGLRRARFEAGMRTVLMVRPGIEFMVLAFGLLRAGAVIILIDPGIGRQNLGKCLGEAAPEAFIGIPVAQVARLALGWANETIQRVVTVGPRWLPGLSYLDLIDDGALGEPWEDTPQELDAIAAIAFTSGSTGTPKGVVYTHRMFSAQASLLQETFEIEPGEIDLATFPLFALFDPAMNVTTVFPDMDFTRPGLADPRTILRTMQEHNVTHVFGSPALLNRVGRFAEQEGLRFPETVRRVLTAGAPVARRNLARTASLLPNQAEVFTPYGATEALPVTSIGSRELLANNGSDLGQGVCVGRPLAGVEVRIIRIEDGPIPSWHPQLEVEPWVMGEIVAAGRNVSACYDNRPDATELAKIQFEGGFFHRMGDLGYRDDDGRIWFCGRKSHRVRTLHGELYSVAAEGLFNAHPAVFRSALVGVGPAGHQEPVLCVELEEGHVANEGLREEILALRGTDPVLQQLTRVLFHPAFPVDIRHNAKIFRERLALWVEAQPRSGGAS